MGLGPTQGPGSCREAAWQKNWGGGYIVCLKWVCMGRAPPPGSGARGAGGGGAHAYSPLPFSFNPGYRAGYRAGPNAVYYNLYDEHPGEGGGGGGGHTSLPLTAIILFGYNMHLNMYTLLITQRTRTISNCC